MQDEIRIKLSSGTMPVEVFFAEMERWLQLLKDMKENPLAAMKLVYIAHDLASHKTEFWSKDEASQRGFADPDGSITPTALVFAKGMLSVAPDHINVRTKELHEGILNWNEVKPLLNALVALNNGQEPPKPYNVNDEVQEVILTYAAGIPGVIRGLVDKAKELRWETQQQVVDWVGYPPEVSTPQKASEELWDKRFRK